MEIPQITAEQVLVRVSLQGISNISETAGGWSKFDQVIGSKLSPNGNIDTTHEIELKIRLWRRYSKPSLKSLVCKIQQKDIAIMMEHKFVKS